MSEGVLRAGARVRAAVDASQAERVRFLAAARFARLSLNLFIARGSTLSSRRLSFFTSNFLTNRRICALTKRRVPFLFLKGKKVRARAMRNATKNRSDCN